MARGSPDELAATRAATRRCERCACFAVFPASSEYALDTAVGKTFGRIGLQASVVLDDRAHRAIAARATTSTSVVSPNVQIIAIPEPFSGSARRCASTGTRAREQRRHDLGAEQRLVALVGGMRHQRDARGEQLGARRLDDHVVATVAMETKAVIRTRNLAILELGLRDRGAIVDVPQRRCFRFVGLSACELAQERALRRALRARARWSRRASRPSRPKDRVGATPLRISLRLRRPAFRTALRSCVATSAPRADRNLS